MAEGPPSWPRRLAATLVLSAPALAVFLVLALTRTLSWPTAGLCAAALVAALGLLLQLHFGRLARLRQAIVSGGGAAPEPRAALAGFLAGLLLPGLGAALKRSDQAQRAVRAELDAAMSGNAAALAGLPDPLVMLDRRRRIVRANPAAQTLFDEAPDGRDLTVFLRSPDLIAAVDEVLEGSETSQAAFTVPGRLRRDFEARLVRLPSAAADGTVAILSLHDLTAVRRTEQLRVDFIANASHELRTPLASLLGFLETLRGPAREDRDAQTRFLGIMHEQALRMGRLIEDLLSLSRIELDEHSVPAGCVDLGALLESVAQAAQPQAAERAMTVSLPQTAPAVRGNRDELAQVFQNLIDNAIKYANAETAVSVTAETGPDVDKHLGRPAVKIAVRDRGEGIARAHLGRLTERFYRVDTARSRALGGTGLGLAIVKHIVNRHRGVLDIESREGEGSIFSVILPLAEAGG